MSHLEHQLPVVIGGQISRTIQHFQVFPFTIAWNGIQTKPISFTSSKKARVNR